MSGLKGKFVIFSVAFMLSDPSRQSGSLGSTNSCSPERWPVFIPRNSLRTRVVIVVSSRVNCGLRITCS